MKIAISLFAQKHVKQKVRQKKETISLFSFFILFIYRVYFETHETTKKKKKETPKLWTTTTTTAISI